MSFVEFEGEQAIAFQEVLQRADIAELRAQAAESALAQARAERDRMAEALKPFAALWTEPAYDGVLYIEAEDRPPDERSWGSDHEYDAHAITYGDLRRASQALTTTTEA